VLADLSRPLSAQIAGLSRIYERPATAAEIRLIGDPPTRGLVSVLFQYDAGPELQTGLAVIDIRGDDVRVLPGLIEMSLPSGDRWHGAILQMQLDRQGRVWGMAPWVGRLIRVTLP